MNQGSLEHFLNSRISHRHLRLILVLDRTRSITEAAKFLNLTQPAVSKSLLEIESSIGLQLFERRYRYVVPTKVGTHLISCAENVLGELTRTYENISASLSGSRDHITIGMLATTSMALYERFITRFERSHSNIHIELEMGSMDEMFRGLAQSKIDIALGQTIDRSPPAGICAETLHKSQLKIVVGGGLEFPKSGSNQNALEQLTWCLPNRRLPLRRLIDRALKLAHVQPKSSTIELASQELLHRLLAENPYAAVVNEVVAFIYSRTSPISVLPIELAVEPPHYCIYTKVGGATSRVCQEALQQIRLSLLSLTEQPAPAQIT